MIPSNCDDRRLVSFADKACSGKKSGGYALKEYPKIYEKRWTASVVKSERQKKNTIIFNPGNHVKMKIEAARLRIAGNFSETGQFLRKALSDSDTSAFFAEAEKAWLKELSRLEIDALWLKCVKDYALICTLSYLNGYYTAFACGVHLQNGGNSEKNLKSTKVTSDISSDLPEDVIRDAVDYFSLQKKLFEEKISAVIEESFNLSADPDKPLKSAFERGAARHADRAHSLMMKASLVGIRAAGLEMYTYVCNNAENACKVCADLDGRNFPIAEAQESVNLPPLHPNCRCGIQAFDSQSSTSLNAGGVVYRIISNMVNAAAEQWNRIISSAIDVISGIALDMAMDTPLISRYNWISSLFRVSQAEYYSSYTTISIGGTEYRINRNTFSAVAVTEEGELVDQDVLGNINYGYFGTYCNIPEIVLLAGAGYAQVRAGTQTYHSGHISLMTRVTATESFRA